MMIVVVICGDGEHSTFSDDSAPQQYDGLLERTALCILFGYLSLSGSVWFFITSGTPPIFYAILHKSR
jgi:hypothetical protein